MGGFDRARSRLHAAVEGVAASRPALAEPAVASPAARGSVARRRLPSDTAGVLAVTAVIAVAAWPLVVGGTQIGQDLATQFIPWYAFLGEQLRALHIPGWNPAQFAGAPFAADPQSGWTYLPAMLFYTALPVAWATKVFIVFHLLLAALGTYALARILGINRLGAVVAGCGYALTGQFYGRSVCCPAPVEVAAWFPLVLLGAELAIRARSWRGRVIGWELTGLALSQVLAAWLGQGSYYVLLALGGYIFYRTLIAPPTGSPLPVPRRLRSLAPRRRAVATRGFALLVHGGVVLAFGFGLAAAGIVPRLSYNSLSNLAGGAYAGQQSWASSIGGITPQMVAHGVLSAGLYYPGAASLLLALLSPLVVRRRYAATYFSVLSLAALILAAKTTTPLHWLFYHLLPRFEELHRHYPERVAMVAYLGLALLAGATVSALSRWRGRWLLLAAAALAPVAVAVVLVASGAVVAASALAGLVAAGALVAAAARWPAARRAVPALLVLVVCADLLATGRGILADGPYGGFHRVNLDAYYAATGAAAFLRGEPGAAPFRYFGYDPQLETTEKSGAAVLYRYQFADPRTNALIVNNRATILGLQDIQGYDPVQLADYVAYLQALNGRTQDYHEANVYGAGLTSPLLDLLNVRYIVVPADTPANRPDLRALSADHPVVYDDGQVKVLENDAALPRAWIVHQATRVQPGAALAPLASGAVDPRRTALLQTAPPPLAQPRDPTSDVANITLYQPDRIRLDAHTSAAGLLLLSEVYYPDWKAYVDGKAVPLYRADDLLRGVPLPAGTHTVELRFESGSLRLGLAISLATIAAAVLLLLWAVWQTRWAARRRSPTP